MFKSRHSQRSNSSTKSSEIELADDPKHWSNNIREASLSTSSGSLSDCLLVGGGAEFGELCWIANIRSEREIALHGGEKFSIGDIILELENQSVVGFTSYDLLRWLGITSKNGNVISIKCVSPAYLIKDLRKYLNTRFQRHSLDHQLQHTIRLNVYRRTVPCTTRKMRDTEIDGVDYRFLSLEEFQLLENDGELLESGSYSGNFYGTPLPPKHEDVDFHEYPSTPQSSGSHDEHHLQFTNVIQHMNGRSNVNMANLKLLDGSVDSKGEDDDGALPPGWERVDSYPAFGVFYVDHINKRTQFERPESKLLKKKRKVWSRNILGGEFITTRLIKGSNGLGFTIIGGDETNDLLQIKTIIPGGAAYLDQKLQRGDILVNVDGQEVLGSSYKEIVHLFQAVRVGKSVPIVVCRGYPLSFDPDDPSNRVITTMAVQPSPNQNFQHHGRMAGLSPLNQFNETPRNDAVIASDSHQTLNGIESIKINLVRGPDGFRFTLSDLPGGQGPYMGQKVRSILDRSRCGTLREGDVIEKINNITVSRMTHVQVVEILKACPVGRETEFVILRGVPPAVGSSSLTPSMERSPQILLDSDNTVYSKVIKPRWKNDPSGNCMFPDDSSWQVHLTSGQGIYQSHPHGFGRSKTPGPILVRTHNNGEESDKPSHQLHQDNHSSPPEHHFHSRSRSSCRPIPQDKSYKVITGSTPDFVPSHHFSKAKFSKDLLKSGLPSANRVPAGPTYSSSASATPVQFDNFCPDPGEYQVFPVRLFRQAEGFGLKLGGGSEHGSSAIIITHIVPGGASDLDGRMKVGDELVSINFTPLLSCQKAKEALAEASAQGVVNLELRRRIKKGSSFILDQNNSSQFAVQKGLPYSQMSVPIDQQYTQFQKFDAFSSNSPSISSEVREVTLVRMDQQSFGFTIISTSAKSGSRICSIAPDGPASQCGQLHVDDLLLAINGIDVRNTAHEDIVSLIRSSGRAVTLLVTTPSPFDAHSPDVSEMYNGEQNKLQRHPSHGIEPLQSFNISNKNEDYNMRSYNHFDEPGDFKQISNSKLVDSKFHYIEIQKSAKGFGFTISGGREYGEVPLSILKIAEGGPAAQDGNLKVGDLIVEINGQNTSGMTHSEAIQAVQSNPTKVALLIKRQNYSSYN